MVAKREIVPRFPIIRKVGAASALVGSLLSLAILAEEAVPTKPGDGNLENGRHLYGMNCQQCHGPNGDDLHCQDMVPLAGLSRRPRVGLVGWVFSPSYFFRGRSYEGADARDLAAYLVSLKGERGFDDPGLRCAPRVLVKRFGLLDAYRVIDVRSPAAYAKGHIPNAVSWPATDEHAEGKPEATDLVRQKLGSIAVRPAMSILIYDDTVTPAAAQLWWDLIRAGHQNVAILDGGLRGWADEGGYLTAGVTPLAPIPYDSSQTAEVAPVRTSDSYLVLQFKAGLTESSSFVFDWERTVEEGQLRPAPEIRDYLKRTEISFPGSFRVEGSDAEASFLVYTLRLLGHDEAFYDPDTKLLIVKGTGHRVVPGLTP